MQKRTETKETAMVTKDAVAKLSKDNVSSVYSGKDGKCCCGCAGTHSTVAGSITRVINTIKAAPADAWDVGPNYVAAVVGQRIYIAYLAEAAR